MEALRTTSAHATLIDGWVEMLRTMSRCGRVAQRTLNEQIGEQFGLSQAMMLWACRDLAESAPSQLELANYLGLSPAQVSGLVDSLRRDGLLASERSPHDRRRQTWRLTAEGTLAASNLDEQLAGWAAECTSVLEPNLVAQMLHSLHMFERMLDRSSNATAPTRREAAA